MTLQSALTTTVNQFIQEQGLTEAEVAKRCHLNVSTVRRISRGTSKYTTPKTALKLMQGIGVSPEQFYEAFEENRSKPPILKVID